MQYIDFFLSVKIENFIGKNDIFDISVQNIDCGFMLEPPRWVKNNKNRYAPVNPRFFFIYRWG